MLWSGLGIPIYSLFGGTVIKRFVDIAVSLALLAGACAGRADDPRYLAWAGTLSPGAHGPRIWPL
jgi:hypothetical protein